MVVSTRRSSFSVPALPSSSDKLPRGRNEHIIDGDGKKTKYKNEIQPMLPFPPRSQKTLVQQKTQTNAPMESKISKDYSDSSVINATNKTSCHFLHDINLDGDLLSIPDPPSPSKRHRRHKSSPFQDVTNTPSSNEYLHKKRQSFGIYPSTPSVPLSPSPSTDNALLDLSGAMSDFSKPSASARRHSFAFHLSPKVIDTPAPTSFCLNQTEESKELDNSEFNSTKYNIDVQSSKHNSMASEQEDEPQDNSFSLPRLTRLKRERYSLSNPSPLSSTSESSEIILSGMEHSISLSSRPPRPLSSMHQSRKNRKSMFLPRGKRSLSPIETSDMEFHRDEAQNQDSGGHDLTQGSILKKNMEPTLRVKPMSSSTTTPFEIDNSDDSTSKLRKKRQSLLLPSDNRDEVLEFFEGLINIEKGVPKRKKSRVKTINKSKESCKTVGAMATIRTLVFNYCSLPSSERRFSEKAKKIEDFVQYPIAVNDALSCDGSTPDLNQQRQALLLELCPIVEKMDKEKHLEKEECERDTGFRVVKAKSGRYRYYNQETSERASASEYEKIYLQRLQQTANDKRLAIQTFFKDFDSGMYERQVREYNRQKIKDEKKIPLESNGTDEIHKLFDTDERLDSMDVSGSGTQEENGNKKFEDKEANNRFKSSRSLFQWQVTHIPPRSDVPKNPNKAEAHRKLWNSIDCALDEYSREIES
jgi:hypothetical protein